MRFNGGYSAQVYAGAGYAVLKPNYRGSRNYGNAHRTDIVGDYFTLGFDDIMTGVDYLITPPLLIALADGEVVCAEEVKDVFAPECLLFGM